MNFRKHMEYDPKMCRNCKVITRQGAYRPIGNNRQAWFCDKCGEKK